jgi:uncharacterized membrane protein YidH (DUF202 family)
VRSLEQASGTVRRGERYGRVTINREYAFVADINREDNVTTTRTSFDVGKVIAAIALLLLVLGLLKWIGVSPI